MSSLPPEGADEDANAQTTARPRRSRRKDSRAEENRDDDFDERPPRRRRRKRTRLWLLLVGIFTAIVLIFVGLAAVFWGSGASLADAQATADDYYRAIAKKDWDAAVSLYSPDFFRKTPEDQWRRLMPRLSEKLGAYQSHALVGWRIFAGTGGSRTVLNYQVRYANGVASETMTFVGTRAGKHLLIYAHQVNSPALLGLK